MIFFKKLTTLLLCCFMILSMFCVNSSASGSYCWFIKRNGNGRPTFPEESEMVRKYNGYFIDDSLDENEKRLYLTFDAGYENGKIERVLDALKSEKAPAAFFVLDNLILKNTDTVIRMGDEGHLVCNHTKRHKDLSFADKGEIEKDLSALEEIYKEKTGREMARYFRFPEGRYSENAMKAICELGYKTVFWSFAYYDWDNSKQPSPDAAKKKILENTHNGAVILLHPTSATNAEILPELISAWREMGYSFGSLDELCGK